MKIDHYSDPLGIGVHTYGTNQAIVGGRFGGAYKNGRCNLYQWAPDGTLDCLPARKCATYRKAQRKLLQWLKGYNV